MIPNKTACEWIEWLEDMGKDQTLHEAAREQILACARSMADLYEGWLTLFLHAKYIGKYSGKLAEELNIGTPKNTEEE